MHGEFLLRTCWSSNVALHVCSLHIQSLFLGESNLERSRILHCDLFPRKLKSCRCFTARCFMLDVNCSLFIAFVFVANRIIIKLNWISSRAFSCVHCGCLPSESKSRVSQWKCPRVFTTNLFTKQINRKSFQSSFFVTHIVLVFLVFLNIWHADWWVVKQIYV